jgi:archaellum component FlaC
MPQITETDIRDIKDLIIGLDKKIDAVAVQLNTVEKKVDDLKSDLRVVDTRLIEVEKKIEKQDSRLWWFIGVILTASLATIFKLLAFPNS